MSSRWQGGTRQPAGPDRFFESARPILIGLVAASLIVLTLLTTGLLATQEQALISRIEPVATELPVLPSTTSMPLSAARLPDNQTAPARTSTPTILPPTDQPSPSPTASPTTSPSPSSTASPTPSPTSSRTPEPTPTLLPSPTSTLELAQASQSSPDSAVQCKAPSSWHKYRVKNSQTVKSLANYFGTTTSKLKSANCLTSNHVRAGTILWVPNEIPAKTQPKPTSTPDNSGGTEVPWDHPS